MECVARALHIKFDGHFRLAERLSVIYPPLNFDGAGISSTEPAASFTACDPSFSSLDMDIHFPLSATCVSEAGRADRRLRRDAGVVVCWSTCTCVRGKGD